MVEYAEERPVETSQQFPSQLQGALTSGLSDRVLKALLAMGILIQVAWCVGLALGLFHLVSLF